ncbi:MAG: GAF domain-containing protein, partial [Chloroflexi bacterium]
SARSEGSVFQAFSRHVSALDLVGLICFLDDKKEYLVVQAAAQPKMVKIKLDELIGEDVRGFRFHLKNTGLHHQVIDEGKTVYLQEWIDIFLPFFKQEKKLYVKTYIEKFPGAGCIFSPLITTGNIEGLLVVFGARLSNEESMIVQAFANQVSAALENARLFANLQQAEIRYRSLFEYSIDGIAIIDPGSASILSGNNKLGEMLGYPRDEFISMSIFNLIAPEYKGQLANAYDTCLREGQVIFEIPLLRKDGSEFLSQVSGILIEAEGQVLIQAVVRDITETKQAETALRRRADELSMLHDFSLDITSSHDLPSLLKKIVVRAANLLGAVGGCLYICDDERKEVRCVFCHNTPTDYTGQLLSYGEGAAGVVAASRAPLIIDDYRSWEGQVIFGNETLSLTGVITVPMIWQGEAAGILQVLDNTDERTFTKDDVELLALFADQAVIAIETTRLLNSERKAREQAEELREASRTLAAENAELFESQKQRAAELEAVRQATLSLTSSLELESVLYSILHSTLKLLPDSHNVHIFLYHAEDGGRLTFGTALWQDGRRGSPIAEPRPEGMTFTVARTGEMCVVADMNTHPFYANIAPNHPDWALSIVGLPLKIGQRVVGVMNIAYNKPRSFNDAELRVLCLLGDQAAIAIENARLYQQAASERRHLGLLYDVSQALGGSLEPDTILDNAIRLTFQALGGLTADAYLYDPYEQRLSLRALYGRSVDNLEELDRSLGIRPGKGLIGWVLENDTSVVVNDVNKDSRWNPVPDLDEGAASLIAAPIPGELRPVGVLVVVHRRVSAFRHDHLELLQAVCHLVGLALANAQRYKQVQDLVNLLAGEQDRLLSLIEGLPTGVILLDSDYRLVVANTLGREILEAFGIVGGRERIARLGSVTTQELLSHQDDPLPLEISLEGELNRVFEAQARPLSGESMQWIITIRNVTRERENQLRIQMQERLATVGQLAAGIAHDFNNIMAAILVYTDLLTQDLDIYSTNRERLKIIREQVQRAASLIRQILDFSRRSVMEQTSIDLLPFMKELHKLLNRVLPESIQLELIAPADPFMVRADPTRLQQVFLNLALNARDAMPTGGTLRFEISALKISQLERLRKPFPPPGKWIRISVSDTGHGIPPEALPH